MSSLLFLFLAFQVDIATRDAVVQSFARLDQFQVDFVQESFSDFFEDSVSHGRLLIQRPGKLRMEYTRGDEKLIVWDGETCYEHDRLADTETHTQQQDVADEPLVQLLLYGSNIVDLYLIDRLSFETGDVFRFRPRQDEDYEIAVRFTSEWLPREVTVRNDDGEGTRFLFSDYKLNPGFPQDTFVVPPPRNDKTE